MLLALALAALMAVLEVWPADLRTLLLLERGAVLRGDIWRVFTAHLVNLSATHTFLNVLGLGLVLATLWSILTARDLARVCAVAALSIGLGWVILMPDGLRYVGFSGITHGVFMWGALALWSGGLRWFALVVFACVFAKLGYEFLYGAVPGAGEAIGGRVSYVSHTLGALGGALAARKGPLLVRLACIILCLGLSVVQADREATRLAMTVLHD